jgi:Mg-chelatase subunit ChlD
MEEVQTNNRNRPGEQKIMSQLELNKGDNFIFGVDVSASMQESDCPGGLQRIEYLKEKVITFAKEAGKYDDDGIDVLTFGASVNAVKGVTPEKAEELIRKLKANEGATMTHLLIQQAYALHKAGGYAQTVLFVATDGAPSDQAAVKSAIVSITQELKEEHEFAISFLTVGIVTPQLRTFLDGLDDDLKGAKFDIVDVKALEDVDFVTAFSGALHD